MSAKAMEIIKQEVEGNPVVLYMKGTPDFPQCGFSARSAEARASSGPFRGGTRVAEASPSASEICAVTSKRRPPRALAQISLKRKISVGA